jgi:hypothetical protein
MFAQAYFLKLFYIKAKTSLNYLQSTPINSNNTTVHALSQERLNFLKLQNQYEDLKNEMNKQYYDDFDSYYKFVTFFNFRKLKRISSVGDDNTSDSSQVTPGSSPQDTSSLEVYTQKDFLHKYKSLIAQYFTREEDLNKSMRYYSETYPVQMMELKSEN